MDPSVLAALQQLYQLAGPLFGGTSSGAPSMGAVTGGGAGGGWMQALINLLLSGTTAYGASKYGSQTLNNQQQLWDLQKEAIRRALGLRTGNLAEQAARNAMPLDRRLAYTVSQAADQGTALRGMSQSPGAVAAGEATALAPFAERNLEIGAGLTEAGNQLSLAKLAPAFSATPPDYLSILDQLGKLGFNSASTYGLPSGVVGATP